MGKDKARIQGFKDLISAAYGVELHDLSFFSFAPIHFRAGRFDPRHQF